MRITLRRFSHCGNPTGTPALSSRSIQERSMRLIHIPVAAVAFYLGLSISIAPAQQNQLSDPGQQQRHDNMIQTRPGQNGKEEPSSHTPGTASATDIFVNGRLVVP